MTENELATLSSDEHVVAVIKRAQPLLMVEVLAL
jgi:hypothetical protein